MGASSVAKPLTGHSFPVGTPCTADIAERRQQIKILKILLIAVAADCASQVELGASYLVGTSCMRCAQKMRGPSGSDDNSLGYASNHGSLWGRHANEEYIGPKG